MEVTSSKMCGDDVKVGGMMHLLCDGHLETKDVMYKTIEDVYHNFTCIHKAAIARIKDPLRERSETSLAWLRIELPIDVVCLITFCRWSLNRILEEDGTTINQTLAALLADIELYLLYFINNFTPPNFRHYLDGSKLEDIKKRICKACYEPLPFQSHQLTVSLDLMLEFLHQFQKHKELIILRKYLELLIKDQIHRDHKLLSAVDDLVSKMARDYYSAAYKRDIYVHVLKALVSHSDSLLMSDEFLVEYDAYVKRGLSALLSFHLNDESKDQLHILQEWILFVNSLLFRYLPSRNSEYEQLSNTIRLDFQALVGNVGSLIVSFFENPVIEEMSPRLFDLNKKFHDLKGEIIKAICCTVLLATERESPKKDQMGSLIILLQNLKEFMDRKLSSIITWNDHDNLVFFIFYLVRNKIRGGDCTLHLELDLSMVNHEELNGVLVSAQVVAFNMASYFSLRIHGRFLWRELNMKTHGRMHMRVGILKAIALSSTRPLSHELLIAYGVCIQDCSSDLPHSKCQFNILLERLPFFGRFLTCYRDEQAKLPHFRADFQELVSSIVAVLCSSFKNTLNGDTKMQQSTTEHSNLVRRMNIMTVEAKEFIYLMNIKKVGCESPKTNQMGSLNSILENWKELMECESDLIITWKEKFQMIHKNLVLLKSFIKSSSNGSDESKNLCSSIVDAGHVAEYLLSTFSFGTCPVQCTSQWISEFMKHVEVLTGAVMEVNEKNRNMKIISTPQKERSRVSVQALRVLSSTDVVVGFEVEMNLIRDRLTSHLRQLDVISIIGMPGLGKTTLARKAYEDRYIVDYFDVRAWCSVTQEYNNKDLLLTILGSISQLTDETRGKNETDLSVMVHKELTGRRYFVVLDDIWKINAFMRLKLSFPDDCIGSRILLTSRSKQIGLKAKIYSDSVEPGLLTEDESWDLLQQKIYNSKEMCPGELCAIGKEIAKECKGLPLAVVVIAGVLKKSTQNGEFWEQVLENLNSHLARDSQSQFMASLELSYEYLPDCLRPMFLYFGAFPKDMEIPVKKLMRLWVAEGFVEKTELLSLEDHAKKNLMDLIDRSLVMVAKRKWDGRIKACLVHDLLRHMCIVKAKEENFMQQIHVHRELPHPVMYQRRLSIILENDDDITSGHLVAYADLPTFSITPPIYSLLFFGVGDQGFQKGIESVISSVKLLKVIDADIFEISQDVLDKHLTMLLGLKYVSFQTFESITIPPTISRLRNLETLIIKKWRGTAIVPETIWEMTKLRHLHIGYAKFNTKSENSFVLENLQTFSKIRIDRGQENYFRKVPALKQLGCIFEITDQDTQHFQLLDFESLDKLESLDVFFQRYFTSFKLPLTSIKLPLTLKKLKIGGPCLSWSQISILKTLPNLEFLQLSRFAGDDVWDMGDDDVFTNLKFLKLKGMPIKRWNGSFVNFPSLERLVLDDCWKLEEIPSDLGEIDTLQKIDVIYCNNTLEKLVKEIQKEQEDLGNDSLQFYYKMI